MGVLNQSKEDEAKGLFLDFGPYLNLSPFTAKGNTPVLRVYALFRKLGLRHLVVVGGGEEVIGIITAKELDEHHLKKLAKRMVKRNRKDNATKIKFASERMAYLRGHDLNSQLQEAFAPTM